MITKRVRLAMLFMVPLLIPIAVSGQMRVEWAHFEPIPTLSINRCSLGRGRHEAAWTAMMATARMESDPAKELLMVLPNTPLAGARIAAERYRGVVEGASIRHRGSPHAVVTMSCGIASALGSTGLPPDWSQVITRVAEALYRAKHAGRNRVSA